jgi:Zn-dependent protease with chaperone function
VQASFDEVVAEIQAYIEGNAYNIVDWERGEDEESIIVVNPNFSFRKYFLSGEVQSLRFIVNRREQDIQVRIYQFFDNAHEKEYWAIKQKMLQVITVCCVAGLLGGIFDLIALVSLYVPILVHLKEYFQNSADETFDKLFDGMMLKTRGEDVIIAHGSRPFMFTSVFGINCLYSLIILGISSIASATFLVSTILLFLLNMLTVYLVCVLTFTRVHHAYLPLVFFSFFAGLLVFLMNFVSLSTFVAYPNLDGPRSLHIYKVWGAWLSFIGIFLWRFYDLVNDIGRIELRRGKAVKSYLDMSSEERRNIPYVRGVIFGMWLGVSFFSLIGVMISAYSFIAVVVRLFGGKMLSQYPLIVLALMASSAVPVLCVWVVYLRAQINAIKTYSTNHFSGIDEHTKKEMLLICDRLKCSLPIINLTDDKAQPKIENKFFNTPVLRIPGELLKELNHEEIVAVMAHELYHVKYHHKKFIMWRNISMLTLFGSDFAAFFFKSIEHEYDADKFAFNYVEEVYGKGKGMSMVSAIKTIDKFPWSGNGASAEAFVPSFRVDKKQLNNFYDKFKHCMRLYLGNQDMSYFHPPTKRREEFLQSLC